MKETKIMKVFEQFVKKFDMNKGNVKAMYFHSIKMMELCKDIASSLGIFTEEEIIVCGMIGLFHDVGSFNNKFGSYYILEDDGIYVKRTMDILFDKEHLIREITEDTSYDDLIKVSIYCNSKNGLPNGFDAKTLHFCRVLKDAHVLEDFRLITNYPYMDMHIDNFPNDLVYNDFKQYRVVNAKVSDNDADKILEVMSFVFGVYYNYSFSLIQEEDCINKLLHSLKFNNKNIAKFFTQIASVLNVYVNRKVGG